ncbi:peroxidase 52 [Setaria italica]|uniref:peroxidase 52 n=1 Tax=Setaria italica TaxID=4555 RepID=UPI000645CD8D|nr:peroxidase 52 [Setaria italica]
MAATRLLLLMAAALVLLVARGSDAQLSAGFYSASCPSVHGVVRQVMSQAVMNNSRSGAAILRLFFHDCFVNGCDASLLLDDTPTTPGEKGAGANAGGSTFGFDLIDDIKTQVEAACPATVSCADILALAARDSVNLLGGPSWAVPLGRRDATSPNATGAATDLPGPDSSLDRLVAAFAAKGLTSRDLAALSGAHTVGMARCLSFRTRVYCDDNVSPAFASQGRQLCPASGGDATAAPLDASTPAEFDNGYYRNLVAGAGLLHSDQELFNNGPLDSLVRLYSANGAAFSSDFAASMVRLGNVSPLTGSAGEQKALGFGIASESQLALLAAVSCLAGTAAALSTEYYNKRCPSLQPTVRSAVARAVAADPNAGAAVLRLFFHDCFVNGCDASVLLDDGTAPGEKGAGPNANSLRGYEVIDAAKSAVEAACPGAVSCADVLAIAARDAVSLLGGPSWNVRMGRRDARSASRDAANANLPGPGSGLPALVAAFKAKGLSARDMTALSGAHTVGRARCAEFRGRVNANAGEAINATFAAGLRGACPAAGGADGALAPLDPVTPDAFDNGYFRALVERRGLLHSDQELFNGGSQDALVRKYASNGAAFFSDFAKAMVRMGNLAPAPGTPLEVRINCRRPN